MPPKKAMGYELKMDSIIDHDLLNVILSCIRLPHEDELMQIIQDAEREHIPVSKPEVCAFIAFLSRLKQPVRVLEIGTAIGVSALVIAESLPEGGTLTTIERDEEMAFRAKQNFTAFNLQDRIVQIVDDAVLALPFMNGLFDMIYIDAAKGQYPLFFREAHRLLASGGLLIADNMLFGGRVLAEGKPTHKSRTIVNSLRQTINEVDGYDFEAVNFIPLGDGLLCCIK